MAECFEYTAYMDETGHAAASDQHFCGMAGFLATTDRWQLLETKWKETLKRFNVDYMHMKEFGSFTGVFKAWKGDESKRKRFYGELLAHLREIRAIPFGAIYSLDAYRKLSDEDRAAINDPYLKSLCDCVGIPARLLEDKPPEIKYNVVFGEQTEFRHRATKIYELFKSMYRVGERMRYPDFKDMREFVPLQAADMIAYELYKEFDRQLYAPTRKPRYGYGQMLRMAERTLPYVPFIFYTEARMRQFINALRSELARFGVSHGNFAQGWKELYEAKRPFNLEVLPLPNPHESLTEQLKRRMKHENHKNRD